MMHASCVAVVNADEPWGLLIIGPSGAGKSALALELMALGARLVADDQTEIRHLGASGLSASAPATLPALIEARGIGLLPVRRLPECRLRVIVDLGQVETGRLPARRSMVLLGHTIPLLHGVDSRSFPAALMQYLRHAAETGETA
jgi:HPr kinase/phosphorylase